MITRATWALLPARLQPTAEVPTELFPKALLWEWTLRFGRNKTAGFPMLVTGGGWGGATWLIPPVCFELYSLFVYGEDPAWKKLKIETVASMAIDAFIAEVKDSAVFKKSGAL